MKKKPLIELVVTAALAVVLIAVILNTAKKPGHQQLGGSMREMSGLLSARDQARPMTPYAQRDFFAELEEQARGKAVTRDPFVFDLKKKEPPPEPPPSEPVFRLDGISWDEKMPVAIINGEIVQAGSRVGPATVIEIRRDRVILNDGSADFALYLQQDNSR